MKQLKPQDAQFVFMEDGQVAAHVTSINICDQSTAPDEIVRFKDILQLVENRLSAVPMYSQKLMRLPFDFDFPYWVEDKHFDLEYHVRHNRLPEPSDWRQFCIQVARIHSRPLDLSRPPWEIDILSGLDNVEGVEAGSFAVVVKMHHCAVDGTSAQEFLLAMMDVSPDGTPVAPPKARRGGNFGNNITLREAASRAALNGALTGPRLASAAMRLAPKIATAAANKALKKETSSAAIPKTRFDGDVSPNRAFDAISFDLNDFKTIARAFGDSKVNDVVLAVCSGALREYLSSKSELPKESLVVTAPVNKRAVGAEITSDGNDISAMSVPLFTNIKDPAERLKAITRASQSAKSEKSGLGSRVAMDLSQHLPAPTLAAMGPLLRSGAFSNALSNAIVSNVAGAPFPTYFSGAKVTHTFGMAPIGAGLGLFIATPSYNGKMFFSITTTRQIVPDTPFFMSCLKRALKELKEIAVTLEPQQKSTSLKKRARRMIHKTRTLAEISADREKKAKKEHKAKKKKKQKKKAARKKAAQENTNNIATQPNGVVNK